MKNIKILIKHFDRTFLSLDAVGEKITFNFYCNSYREAKEKLETFQQTNQDQKEEIDLKTIPLSNYKIPTWYKTIFNLDLSWQRLGGKLVIEDWANLKKLNVGHNEIVELEIRNCPNLIWLNYSYNALTKQEIIESCPLLTPENTFSEKKSNYVVPDDFVPNTPLYDEIP